MPQVNQNPSKPPRKKFPKWAKWTLGCILLIAAFIAWQNIVPPSGLTHETAKIDQPAPGCNKLNEQFSSGSLDNPPQITVNYSCNGDYRSIDAAISKTLNAQGCNAATTYGDTNIDYQYDIDCRNSNELINGSYLVEVELNIKGSMPRRRSYLTDTPTGDAAIAGYVLTVSNSE